MKKLLLVVIVMLGLVGCSSADKNEVTIIDKYNIDEAKMKDWPETIPTVIKGEAYIVDWYGNEDPILNLRKKNTMTAKDFTFLQSIEKRETPLTVEEKEEFTDLINKYVKKSARTFKLQTSNLKNPEALIDEMISESLSYRVANPSEHILNEVALPEEKQMIVEWGKEASLTDKQKKKFVKLLNQFISRKEFYDVESWRIKEISPRLEEIESRSKEKEIDKKKRNNINAKALYIAYSDYLSELDRWK